MKKINFARAHQVLSEKEMKNVLGGSGGVCQITCISGTRDPNVNVTSCYDHVWPCGYGNQWNCWGC